MLHQLISLWFSHIQMRQSQKTSPQISCATSTKSHHQRPWANQQVSTYLTTHGNALQLKLNQTGVRSIIRGGGSTHSPTESICLLQHDKLRVLCWFLVSICFELECYLSNLVNDSLMWPVIKPYQSDLGKWRQIWAADNLYVILLPSAPRNRFPPCVKRR